MAISPDLNLPHAKFFDPVFCAAAESVSCLLKKNYAQILESDPAKEMVRLAFAEALSVARAAGQIAAEPDAENRFLWETMRVAKTPPASPKRPLKALASLLASAKKNRILCPVLEQLYLILKEYVR